MGYNMDLDPSSDFVHDGPFSSICIIGRFIFYNINPHNQIGSHSNYSGNNTSDNFWNLAVQLELYVTKIYKTSQKFIYNMFFIEETTSLVKNS